MGSCDPMVFKLIQFYIIHGILFAASSLGAKQLRTPKKILDAPLGSGARSLALGNRIVANAPSSNMALQGTNQEMVASALAARNWSSKEGLTAQKLESMLWRTTGYADGVSSEMHNPAVDGRSLESMIKRQCNTLGLYEDQPKTCQKGNALTLLGFGLADLRGAFPEFLNLWHRQRDQFQNPCCMGLNHVFSLWYLTRTLKPLAIIELGVSAGHQTWLLRQTAGPSVPIFAVDPVDPVNFKGAKPWKDLGSTKYFVGDGAFQDFSMVDWLKLIPDPVVRSQTLIVMDDRRSFVGHFLSMQKFGFRWAFYGNNYPFAVATSADTRTCKDAKVAARDFPTDSYFVGDAYSPNAVCGADPPKQTKQILHKDVSGMLCRYMSLDEHRVYKSYLDENMLNYFEFPPLWTPCNKTREPVLQKSDCPPPSLPAIKDEIWQYGHLYPAFAELSLMPSAGANNLCMDGNLVPEFMLLGAQKSATSSYAGMFLAPGVVFSEINSSAMEPGYFWKEPHFFDDLYGRYRKGKQFWLSHYPKCDRMKRMVATDFTPSYLNKEMTPTRIRMFYGDKSSQIKFGVILRNPLNRMHSAFHFYQGKGWCDQQHLDRFQSHMQRLIQGKDPCNFLHDSKYGEQLAEYFNLFAASQFTIIPFGYFTTARHSSFIVMKQWWRLGLTGGFPVPQKVNANVHNSLQQDLDPQSFKAIDAYISRSVGAQTVAKVLAAQDPKPELVGFAGDRADVDSITSWLETNW